MNMDQVTWKYIARMPKPGSGVSSVINGGIMVFGQLWITYGMRVREQLVLSLALPSLFASAHEDIQTRTKVIQ